MRALAVPAVHSGALALPCGAAPPPLRRMDELARSNRELLAVNRVARASASLASGESLAAALERLADEARLRRADVLRCEAEGLVTAAQRGFTPRTPAPEPLARPTPRAESAR